MASSQARCAADAELRERTKEHHAGTRYALCIERVIKRIGSKMRTVEDIMNAKQTSASLAGSLTLGGEVSVHRLGFGAMRLTGDGIWGAPKNRTEALAVLRRAVELDVNFIDTADSYGPNVNEELIAEALFPYPSGLVIATKGGWNRPGPNQWTHDATPAHLREAVYCRDGGGF